MFTIIILVFLLQNILSKHLSPGKVDVSGVYSLSCDSNELCVCVCDVHRHIAFQNQIQRTLYQLRI